MAETIFVEEELYQFLQDCHLYLRNINLLDLFPIIIEQRIATKTTIRNLITLARKSPNNKQKSIPYDKNNAVLVYLKNSDKIYEEEIISSQLLEAIGTYKPDNIRQLAYLCRDCNEIFNRIIQHPLINPLIISILCDSDILFKKYITSNDVRISLIRTYKSMLMQ
jgi:hypothetical protein